MKNIFDQNNYTNIMTRIELLTEQHIAHWGKMNVNQMLCHCADAMRDAIGATEKKDKSSWFSRNILKRLVFLPFRFTKNLPTAPDYDTEKNGTQPKNFQDDKDVLLKLVSNFYYKGINNTPKINPYFGTYSGADWGKHVYKHLDHHLTQFGV